jgi:hypothetical protein
LIEKTDFLQNLQRAAPRLGRIKLGERLDAMAGRTLLNLMVG